MNGPSLPRRRRVLVVTSTFPRWPADATARFVLDSALAVREAWDVTVLAPHADGAASFERLEGIDVHRFRYGWPARLQRLCYGAGILSNVRESWLARAQVPSLLAGELVALRTLAARRAFDVIHAHFVVPQGLIAAACTAFDETPLVVSCHGSDVYALRGAAWDAMTKYSLRRAAVVTANGEAMRGELVRRFDVGDKTVVVPMGVDLETFSPPPSPPTTPSVLFVGRLVPQKGVVDLLDAWPRVLERFPRARLTVVGAGPLAGSIERHPCRRRSVRVLGPLSRSEVAQQYRAHAVVVVPSRSGTDGTEAQGLVALEALASGCLTVVTRAGGLSALIDRDLAFAAAPGDPASLASALVEALDAPDADERRRRGERHAREHCGSPRTGRLMMETYERARKAGRPWG